MWFVLLALGLIVAGIVTGLWALTLLGALLFGFVVVVVVVAGVLLAQVKSAARARRRL